MSSEVGAGLVMFIAAVAVAGLAAAGLSKAVGQMATEIDNRGDTLADAIGSDVAIVNDPENVPYDSGTNTLTIYLKNTGSKTLVDEELMLLVDGQHETFDARLLEGASRWSRGTVLEANVTIDLASGDHTVRAVYTPNLDDELTFRI